MKWKKKGHEFDEIAEILCGEENACTYYIWGAGVFGISFYHLFENEIKIEGFIDSNPEKQKLEVEGKKVYEPKHLLNTKAKVLVSSGWTNSICSELEKMGFRKNKDYFHIDEFTSIYMMYKYGKLYVSDITYAITENCTLKCKNCNSFMPLMKNKNNYAVEEIVYHFDCFFQWVDYVNVLGLVGGDAMAHPQFTEILEIIGEKYYPQKAGHIEVYSNAVIVPNEKQIELMKKYQVYYRFSDYTPYTQGRQKIEKITALLDANGIKYDHVKFEKWCDCGYPQESNQIEGDENLNKFFMACDRRSCHNLSDRGIMYCGMALSADKIDYCRADDDDFFQISDFDETRKKELMEFMLGYSDKGYLAYCRKCNGGANVNKKLIEAGEQL